MFSMLISGGNTNTSWYGHTKKPTFMKMNEMHVISGYALNIYIILRKYVN